MIMKRLLLLVLVAACLADVPADKVGDLAQWGVTYTGTMYSSPH